MSKYALYGYVIVWMTLFGACEYRELLQGRRASDHIPSESHTAQRIEEYQQDIQKYRKELQAAVQAAGKIARFNTLLAIEYIKVGMFGLALDSAREALVIEPNNEILFYLSGVSAMQLARIHGRRTPEHIRLTDEAEHFFQRSIALKDDYLDPLLGISTLYIFDLHDSVRALSYLEQAYEIDSESSHIHALFGRVYSEREEFARAAEHYQRASELSQDRAFREKSLENVEILRALESE